MSGERLMRTGEAAKELGISPRTLARYAADGKVTPARAVPGQRTQYWWDIEDLRKQLRDLGGR
jgi:DNA-binding transcriptional MerR regulator